jgi:hypothetical protein
MRTPEKMKMDYFSTSLHCIFHCPNLTERLKLSAATSIIFTPEMLQWSQQKLTRDIVHARTVLPEFLMQLEIKY